MFVVKFDFVLFLIFLHVSYCERRIQGGEVVTKDKTYVVYLVKASIAEKRYDSWLCGGALVTTEFILTSAACVEDVRFMYAIAGYNKYVPDSKLEKDDCIKQMKKKVIFTCVPVSYKFDYDHLEKWSYIDIALVKVESPYDLNDATYQIVCSYIPTLISINYDPKHQGANIDAMVLGWGHKDYWRKHGDPNNYNQELLNYASTLILDKEKCKAEYEIYPEMVQIIDKYMICTLANGNIGDNGEAIAKIPANATGCASKKAKLRGAQGETCEEEIIDKGYGAYTMDNTRRDTTRTNQTNNDTITENRTAFSNKTFSATRRNGICQNDHGGPLVTWVGSREMLIGIASVFKVTEDNECVGPYLYTSTQCNGAFIDCVLKHRSDKLTNHERTARQALCDSPPSVKGFDTVERHISWKNHPAGPADNERHETRGRNGASDRYTEKEEHKFKDRFATYEGFPEKNEHKTEDRFGRHEGFPSNKEHKIRDRFATAERVPEKPEHLLEDRFKTNDDNGFVAKEKHTIIDELIENDKFLAEKVHTFTKKRDYAAKKRIPTTEKNVEKVYTEDDGYAFRPQRPLNI